MKHVRERRCLRESSAENERGLCQWDYTCSCASRGPRGPTTGPPWPPGLVWHQRGSVNGPRLGVPFSRVVWGHCHCGLGGPVSSSSGRARECHDHDGPGTRIAVPGLGVGISGIRRELLIRERGSRPRFLSFFFVSAGMLNAGGWQHSCGGWRQVGLTEHYR